MKMTNHEIDIKVAQIETLEAQIKEIQAQVKMFKADLKSVLDESQVDMIDTGLNRIFYEPVERKIVDNDALKADGLYEKYLKSSLSTMFKMTKSK